ncbi:hypothetical protein [Malikia sp.]|uniref:hypothetical protein n=1 Tax=Malikia sp. TaxID=2070706 RepID=UPI002623DA48|nr:hypothetical protein [Malikia sp.]MDD2727691.1 hypothetical protein [Malikia sp.]
MKKPLHSLLVALLAGTAGVALAQKAKPMQLVEVFDAGQPEAVILKLYDQQADVICYVLTPERASRKSVEGNLVYDGNNVGAISCVKNRQQVVDVTPPAPATQGSASAPAAARPK